MADPNRLVEQCVSNGLEYLADSLQYYWPANFDPDGNYLHTFNENNIALHLARSFAEAGFRVWAEVPFYEQNLWLDFFAYSDTKEIAVALEFKKSIDTPPSGSLDDLKRLVGIHNGDGLANSDNAINNAEWIYGIVTVLYSSEFFAWWENPAGCKDYRPESTRLRAPAYKQIGEAIAKKAYSHRILPLNKWETRPARAMYAHTHAAYALFDANSISELKSVLLVPQVS